MLPIQISIFCIVLIQSVWSWSEPLSVAKPLNDNFHKAQPYGYAKISPNEAGGMFINNLKPLLNGEYRLVADLVHIDAIPIKEPLVNPMNNWMAKPPTNNNYPPVIHLLDHMSIRPIKNEPLSFFSKPETHPNYMKQPYLLERPIFNGKPMSTNWQRPLPGYFEQKPWFSRPEVGNTLAKPNFEKPFLYSQPSKEMTKPIMSHLDTRPESSYFNSKYTSISKQNMPKLHPYLSNNNNGIVMSQVQPHTQLPVEAQLNPAKPIGNSKFPWDSKNGEVTLESLLKEYQNLEHGLHAHTQNFPLNQQQANAVNSVSNENQVKLQQLLNGYEKLKLQFQQQPNKHPVNVSSKDNKSETVQPNFSPSKMPWSTQSKTPTTSPVQHETNKTTPNPSEESNNVLPTETTTAYPELTTKINEQPSLYQNTFPNLWENQSPNEKQLPFESTFEQHISYKNPFETHALPFGSDNNSGKINLVLPGEAAYSTVKPLEKLSSLIPFPDVLKTKTTTPATNVEVE